MKSLKIKTQLLGEAKKIFEGNLRVGYSKSHKSEYRFISPAAKEYTFQWLWDTAFHAIVLSHFNTKWAKDEVLSFLTGQRSDGFLPHTLFWNRSKLLPRWVYFESDRSTKYNTTSITQPPALALAVEEIYKKDPDVEFLKNTLDKLANHHRWLLANRDPDRDFLISIISPNESGLDELPVFQYVLNYFGNNSSRLRLYHRKPDFLNVLNRFNSSKILKKDYFNVEELMFNTVFIEANRSLSRLYLALSDKKSSLYFADVANKGEKALLSKSWNSEDKIFYSLFSKGEKQAKVKTVTSLVPLFLEGLKGEKLKALVEKHVLNPKEFWTEYPVPSVAKDERHYTPTDLRGKKWKMLWRGPTWVSTNWFVVKGLRKHGYDKVADEIVAKMIKMVEKSGFREYYNPETGEGYSHENFGWSTLIADLL